MVWQRAVDTVREALLAALADAVTAAELPAPPDLPPVEVERPREKRFGDLSTNFALLLAGRVARSGRQVADILAARLATAAPPAAAAAADGSRDGNAPWEAVEVAGPGFLNFRFPRGWLRPVVGEVLAAGEAYGRSRRGEGRRVQVEFVSANPTGPLNVVNARAAAYGDALARCLEASGHRVEREYYVNDAGTQFEKLALSLEARARQALGQPAEPPEGGYPGDYVADLARDFLAGTGGEEARRLLLATWPEPGPLAAELAALRQELGRYAVERIVAWQRRALEDYGVTYDRWYRESEVRAAGKPEEALRRLREGGHVYEAEGALWFRSTAFGDDQDRVLVRSNGEITYFLADVGYHLTKFERGFDRVIDIWGQDHHGYVPRMRAAVQALGFAGERLEVLLTQLVRLVREGQVVKMSKRRGEYVTMEELLAEVGRDAARFLFLTRSLDAHLDFDLELARRQAADNPVYYVQYAHARICSILRQAETSGESLPWPPADAGGATALGGAPAEPLLPPGTLEGPEEEDLLRHLAWFPAEVAQAAERREPHRLTVFARELATDFHAFYTRCRVLGEEPDVTRARLLLVTAVRQVLANCLGLLGVSAPERM